MWKNVLTGIIMDNIESLRHYQTMKDDSATEVILKFVSGVITRLPWYFHLPVRMLAFMIGMLCVMTTGRNLNDLSSEKRSLFLRRIRFMPFFGMLNKLIRSMAFLKLFDSLPLSPEH